MHNFIPISVRVNTFSALLLIALPTNCGDVFVTTQSTNIFEIFFFTIISWGSAWVIYDGPNMWRHMVPRTIRLIPHLPPHAKLCEM